MKKLTPLMRAFLDKLQTQPGWHRLDKSIGDALARRELARYRFNATTGHHEYRAYYDAAQPLPPVTTPEAAQPLPPVTTPEAAQPLPPVTTPEAVSPSLLDWLEARS